MGHRMELYLAKEHAQAVIDIAQAFNVEARVVGYVKDSAQKSLTIKSQYGEFNY
jgi:phosphoribosylformylglycinamidine cyclo-ligase